MGPSMPIPDEDARSPDTRPSRSIVSILGDLVIALALVAALCGVYAWEWLATNAAVVAVPVPPPPEPEPSPPPTPPDLTTPNTQVDPVPRLAVGTTSDARFGLSTLSGNPDDASDDNKRLTYGADGWSNNT